MNIAKSHPRYTSLLIRNKIEKGVVSGITSLNGLIAHGRGEAFDYLLKERTHPFAKEAIDVAAAMLLSATYPVISVNGNTAALIPEELVTLGKILHAPLEVNLFHPSPERLRKIKKHLETYGAEKVLLPDKKMIIPYIESDRRFVHKDGIMKADVVFVPLEDGDRTEALIKNGKKVITVDLNPLSRTARKATITIVDNIIRVMPLFIHILEEAQKEEKVLPTKIKQFDNQKNLKLAIRVIKNSI